MPDAIVLASKPPVSTCVWLEDVLLCVRGCGRDPGPIGVLEAGVGAWLEGDPTEVWDMQRTEIVYPVSCETAN